MTSGGRYQCPDHGLFEAKARHHCPESGPGPAGKVLLGSDFPNIPHAYAEQIAGLVRLGLGEPWLRAVCWDNAAAMFGLTADPSRPAISRPVIHAAASPRPRPRQARWSRRPMTKANPYSTPITISRNR